MAELFHMREEYIHEPLHKKDLLKDPIAQFSLWFTHAKEHRLIEPNAFTLATVDENSYPQQRTILLKYFDAEGFVFFTNYTSSKAKEIQKNPKVSMHFAWLGVHRQVRIQGSIEKISKSDSLKYFLSRPKGSQIGAWVSHQSQIISSRSLLEQKFEEIKNRFADGKISLPDFWGGYKIYPESFEFWQGGQNRLHDRFSYTCKEKERWTIKRLEP